MPLRRLPGPPDLERVAAVLAGPAPARERGGWVPDPPRRSGPADLEEILSELPSVPDRTEQPEPMSAEGVDPWRPGCEAPTGAGPDPEAETARLDADLRRARRPSVLTMPEQLRTGRLAVSSSAVLSLVALVVALGCAFTVRVLWAERAAEGSSVPSAPGVPAVSVERAGDAGSPIGQTGATTPAAAAVVVVHVVGQVERPGLVRLTPGARVEEAIAKAGGATAGADLSVLNLARIVVDGEQVHVPKPGEAVVGGGGADGGASGGAAGIGGGLVNLNTADSAALDTLPGVGPVLAQRILDWRTEHGRFTSVEELGEVSGIGEKLYAQLRPKVTV